MPGQSVSIELSDGQVSELALAFEVGRGQGLSAAELGNLATMALDSWMRTLLGPSRPRSTTELYINWLRDIYEHHLTEELPSERRLFNNLDFPYGQAAYLARVLRELQSANLRMKALGELETTVKPRVVESKKWVKEGRGEERMSMTVSKAARRELDVVLGTLIEAGTPVRPLKTEGTMGDYAAVLVVAADIANIASEVAKRRKGSTK